MKTIKKAASIEDVARLAGVSVMTVSRVMNRSVHVSTITKEKVENAVKTLNYRPNMVAKSLVTQRTHIVAYITNNMTDLFHTEVGRGIEEICYKRNYIVIICDANSTPRQKEYINMLLDRKVDGAIFHHTNISKEEIERLNAAGIQCVLIDNENDWDNAGIVNTDNFNGGYMAAEHLIRAGHSRIACIHGRLSNGDPDGTNIDVVRTWRERTSGFLAGLSACGIKPERLIESDSRMKNALLTANRFLDDILKMRQPPTAVYCENDVIALSVLSEALEKNVPVPDRLAIVGHDGIETSISLYPRVTTVVLPHYETGMKAADMLIDLIENKHEINKIVLNPKLFVGSTT
ncbi:MAG: LacI family transcriptional regulator [Eubacteriales bacterium]|nr:LacI family transcriptional regulator [Eubacteriales bacterium]